MSIKQLPILLPVAILLLCRAAPSGAESFSSWSAKAAKAEKEGDTMAAIEDYTNALRLWQKSDGKKTKAKILAARAALYEAAGSNEAAVRDLSGALKLDDKASSYFFRRGRLYYGMSRDAEAISDFYRATQMKLDYRDAYFYRGLAYQRQGDAEFAREDFKNACRLGLKEACVKSPKPKAKKAASDEFEAAAGPVKPVKKPKAYKLDWQGCLDALQACTDTGNTYADCVDKAAVCEDEPRQGCCPQSCVTSFTRLTDATKRRVVAGPQSGVYEDVNVQSEAQVYREIFNPDSECMKHEAVKPQ